MSRGRNDIRILLLGEPGVGKTTLILSLVSEEFSPKAPAQAEEITIPADVTPERVPTQIVDYSARTESQEQLCSEIRRADVICLVHALDDEKSREQISSYWLPLIRHNTPNPDSHIPIVLVGNKLDLVPESKLEKVLPIMSDFSEVETCIECSAKSLLNLSETFWFAQKAVLYPTAPLYDADRKELTPACVRALIRVFRICDTDNDGYLSDRELEAFQSRCFSVPLTTQSLQDVKQLVRQSCPGGVTLSGITQKGFLFLHLIFVQKGRHETTWTVLRQFGYDNQIRLSSEFLYPRFSVPTGCSTEISTLGIQFLHTLFNKYDLLISHFSSLSYILLLPKDRDGCLSPAELSELLATCPEDQLPSVSELTDSVTTNSSGWITRQGFLAYWALTGYLEPSKVLEYFAYLGFTYFAAGSFWSTVLPHQSHNGIPVSGGACTVLPSDSASSTSKGHYRDRRPGAASHLSRSDSGLTTGPMSRSARDALLRGLVITTEKRLDTIRRSTKRTVFYCRVYGARKVGKTCLLQGLLGRHLRGSGGLGIGGVAGRASGWTAACGIPVYGQSRTLIMHEIGAAAGEQMTAGEALSADVACLVYDVSDPESFRYVANLFLNYYRGTRVPCLFVAAKSDQPHVVQNFQIDPTELTQKYNLCPPESFSSILLEQELSALRSLADSASDTDLFTSVSHPRQQRRAGSAEPSSAGTTLRPSGGSDVHLFSSAGLSGVSTDPHTNNSEASPAGDPSTTFQTRGRRHSRPDLAYRGGCDPVSMGLTYHHVYITLCTLANYPHLRGLQLAPTDQAWKWTLAATILAGFGFVAFRIAKTHF
ncbi:Mitochondrial Rho GTPase [Fasciolopsis buskii]|uniref:Mitochondrial Rho GTPase n=1 Tax=Fasciolopsis buskii TaxID=27845 RepID=A0A8E0VIL4_9TREM|nr:Mitochondrial Rho GTPase [Fasciolopsis buski]